MAGYVLCTGLSDKLLCGYVICWYGRFVTKEKDVLVAAPLPEISKTACVYLHFMYACYLLLYILHNGCH